MRKEMIYFLLLLLIQSCRTDTPVIDPADVPPSTRQTVFTRVIDKYGEPMIVYSNEYLKIMKAFLPRTPGGESIMLKVKENSFPVIFTDETESLWDVFGRCVSGERQGEQLVLPDQVTGFWFAVSSMYAEVTLLEDEALRMEIPPTTTAEWLVDPGFVYAGAPRNAIPAIRQPDFRYMIKPGDFEINYLQADERVAVIARGDSLLILPLPILNWHEIVNIDPVAGGTVYSYCPLTGTSLFHELPEEVENFGVSGLLYNNNLIMYDETTDSHWSQMRSLAVNGPLKGTSLRMLPVTEMTWNAANALAASMYILEPGDLYDRDYNVYPYGDYETDNSQLLFSVTYQDDRLPAKERVLAVFLNNGVLAVRSQDISGE